MLMLPRYISRMAKKILYHRFILALIAVVLILWWTYHRPRLIPSIPCPPIWTADGQNGGLNNQNNHTGLRAISCDRAFEGDLQEIEYANQFKWCTESNAISNDQYVKLTENCDTFKTQFKYLEYDITKEETEFPIAFSVLLHENVEQTERLLRMIYRPQNFYCIHVDSKASEDIQTAVRSIANCFDNVLLPDKQIGVRWAEYTVLEAELVCMDTLYKASDKWKYFINLTGRDFPLKSNWELVQILKVYNGANDIDGTPHRRPIVWTKYSWRTEYWRTNTEKEPAPHNFLVHKGSTHIAAVRGFVGWALYDPRAIDLREWMKDIRVPDEHFFNTLNHHAHFGVPGAYKGDPDLKRFYTRLKIWLDDEGLHKCSGRWVRFVCQLALGDLSQMTGQPEMFVNKFFMEMDPMAVSCAEQWYRNRTRSRENADFDLEFYRNLNFVKNHV